MAAGRFNPVVRYIYRIAAGQAEQLTDRALLDRYIDERDEEAFALLVHRHGGFVLGVCRRVVQDWHTAEDCFQAVFLVLTAKAHLLPRHEALGSWLHAVAIKVALKANASATIRRIREQAQRGASWTAARFPRMERSSSCLGQCRCTSTEQISDSVRALLLGKAKP